jgi:hypothetical protein
MLVEGILAAGAAGLVMIADGAQLIDAARLLRNAPTLWS